MKQIKKHILDLLKHEDLDSALKKIESLPPKQVLGPLFAGLLNPQELVRWRSISAMGRTVSRLAAQDMEQGRIVMRRLMWSLNDESGGIGWGAPESMAEIMAVNQDLALEFKSILFSYLVEREEGADNFLEYLPLRRGAFWGLARLAQARPDIAGSGRDKARQALEHEQDPFILACLGLYFKLTGLDDSAIR
ncbi:MAG: DVU0298 family protein, partial [Desulfonatronovibrionaceae bacterium]